MLATIAPRALLDVTGAGGSTGLKHRFSTQPAITGEASPSLLKRLGSIKRFGFDLAVTGR